MQQEAKKQEEWQRAQDEELDDACWLAELSEYAGRPLSYHRPEEVSRLARMREWEALEACAEEDELLSDQEPEEYSRQQDEIRAQLEEERLYEEEAARTQEALQRKQKEEGPRRIEIRELTGDQYWMELAGNLTIAQVKGRVHILKGHQPEKQMMVQKGKELQDECSFQEARVEPGFAIILVLKIQASAHSSSGIPRDQDREGQKSPTAFATTLQWWREKEKTDQRRTSGSPAAGVDKAVEPMEPDCQSPGANRSRKKEDPFDGSDSFSLYSDLDQDLRPATPKDPMQAIVERENEECPLCGEAIGEHPYERDDRMGSLMHKSCLTRTEGEDESDRPPPEEPPEGGGESSRHEGERRPASPREQEDQGGYPASQHSSLMDDDDGEYERYVRSMTGEGWPDLDPYGLDRSPPPCFDELRKEEPRSPQEREEAQLNLRVPWPSPCGGGEGRTPRSNHEGEGGRLPNMSRREDDQHLVEVLKTRTREPKPPELPGPELVSRTSRGRGKCPARRQPTVASPGGGRRAGGVVRTAAPDLPQPGLKQRLRHEHLEGDDCQLEHPQPLRERGDRGVTLKGSRTRSHRGRHRGKEGPDPAGGRSRRGSTEGRAGPRRLGAGGVESEEGERLWELQRIQGEDEEGEPNWPEWSNTCA